MNILRSCSQMRSKGCQGVQNVSLESLECFCNISNLILIVGYFFGTFRDYFRCVWSNWANNCLKQLKMHLLLRHFSLSWRNVLENTFSWYWQQKYPNIRKKKETFQKTCKVSSKTLFYCVTCRFEDSVFLQCFDGHF